MEFVTDRTYTDVLKVREYNERGWNELSEEERQEWLAGMKGAFNCTDMNRINEALNFIEKRCAIKDTVEIPYSIDNNTISSSDYKYVYICDIEEGYYVDVYQGVTTYHCVPNNLYRIEIDGDEALFTFYTGDGERPLVRPYCYIGASNTEFPFGNNYLRTNYTMNDYLTFSELKKTIDKYNELNDRCNVIQSPSNFIRIVNKPNFQFFNRLEEILKRGYEFLEQHYKSIPFTAEDFIYPIEWENGYTINSSGDIVEEENYSVSNPIPLWYDKLTIFLAKDVGTTSFTISSYIYSYEAEDYVQSDVGNVYPTLNNDFFKKVTLAYFKGRDAIRISAQTSKIEAVKVQCKAV